MRETDLVWGEVYTLGLAGIARVNTPVHDRGDLWVTDHLLEGMYGEGQVGHLVTIREDG